MLTSEVGLQQNVFTVVHNVSCWCVTVIGMTLTRNSSGDEIANVNFLYDDIVHALPNTIDWCINSATGRRVRTQVYRIQWYNAIQRPLRRSRSFKVIQGHRF